MLNLSSKRFIFFGLSLLVIIPGVLALIFWHFNLGLDFTSGTVVNLQFSRPVSTTTVQQAFAKTGAKNLVVITATTADANANPKYTFYLRFNTAIDDNTKDRVRSALNDLAGQLKQGASLEDEGTGDFTRLVTYDGGKTYFSLLVVRFQKLDTPPALDQIRKAIANLPDLKTTQQPTPTPTLAPTNTATSTSTPTPTGTPPTATPTATNTPAPTATNTPAPTPTNTPGPSPTATATAPSGTPTAGPTATATPGPNPAATIPVALCDDASVTGAQNCGSGNGIQQGTTNQVISVTTSTSLEDSKVAAVEYGLMQSQGVYLQEQSKNSIDPAVATETIYRAIGAVALAAAAILIYIAFAFRKVAHPFRYGACAIIALLHDALVVLGMAAIIGHFDSNYQVDTLFVTAVLTVIGFSVHDTIVVFDRIRENLQRRTNETFEQVVNASLVQTMARSINTSMTVLLVLSALTLFGGVSIRSFTLTLLIGIFSGTYSSIFNASMLLVSWERGELGRLFGFRPRPPEDRRLRGARARGARA